MKWEEVQQKRVLYSCLDWGNGHVSRSIGILRELLKQNNTVYLYCSLSQKEIFEQYNLQVVYVLGEKFRFRFKGDGNFAKEMWRNGFRFSNSIRKEQRLTERLQKTYDIDVILSDHCYGFYARNTPSVFITHQVHLPPKSGRVAQRIHQSWLSKFNTIWILDKAEQQLAGQLSDAAPNAHYIGWFSRFSESEVKTVPGKVVGIVSGPEPYAEQLFNWILENQSTENLTLISPKRYSEIPAHIELISDWNAADEAILSAETIVSRNGYSTLMDLKFLKKKAVLIPTPGQLEQEYLMSIG